MTATPLEPLLRLLCELLVPVVLLVALVPGMDVLADLLTGLVCKSSPGPMPSPDEVRRR